jgi:hypothetical protein
MPRAASSSLDYWSDSDVRIILRLPDLRNPQIGCQPAAVNEDARDKHGHDEGMASTRPMTDVANDPSKNRFVYDRLSFRVYDCERPRLDAEWLLSTLFDASLLSTSKPPETAALFLRPRSFAGAQYRPTPLIHTIQWKP